MRILLFVWLVLASLPSFSEGYYQWYIVSGELYPSVQALCPVYMSYHPQAVSVVPSYPVGSAPSCIYKDASGNNVLQLSVNRVGNTCPPDTVLDGVNGCVVPRDPCADSAGTKFRFSRSGVANDSYMQITADRKWSIPMQTACYGGCTVDTNDQRCKTLVSGAYACVGNGEYTGASCASSDTPVESVPNAVDPVPTKTETAEPCIYQTNPDGTQSCRSSNVVESEGQSCGEINGKRICVTRQPEKNGVTVETTVETEVHPDGSKTISKQDIATHQSCTGANSCTSTTTTTSTTIRQDSAGNTTSSTGTCTGPACPSSGNPDGDQDGYGDCITDDCGQAGGTPELDPGVPDFGESLGDFWGRLSGSPLLTAVGNIRMGQGAGCSLPTSSKTIVGTVSMQPMCDNAHWLDPLYAVFLALHALGAVRILLSA